MAELSARARQILYACITEFVSTGEPVGSRTISKKHGIDLSAASIRNVLSDLEEWGYLQQPHTSAGRVPTDRAFRLFIDALMRTRDLAPEDLREIRERFETLSPGANLMRESGKLLSELTGTVAVVVTPRAESLTLKHLRFVRIQQGELLAVLVLSDGTVQNRFIHGEAGEPDLLRVHNLLDDVIEGRTLGDLRDLFSRRLATEQVQRDDLRRRAFELGGAAVGETLEQEVGAEVVIEGQAKLLEQPEFAGAEGMKQVVNALDERAELVRLLDATLEAKGTTVVVGHEAGDLGGGQLSLIGAAYKDNGRAAGSIGVIGPTRMDYPKVVPLVAATANAMSAFISRRDGRREDRDPREPRDKAKDEDE
jgi:heat-inducible transcriptional repressor